jgi:integrase
MPAYNTDIEREISAAELKAMLDAEKEPKYKAIFYLLGATGARPGELLGLRNRDVAVGDPGKVVTLTLYTEKLHKKNTGQGYAGACRRLQLARPMLPSERLEELIRYMNGRRPFGEDALIFPFSLSALEHRITRVSLSALPHAAGFKGYTPYHFRHSLFSKMASEGASIGQIAQLKGGGLDNVLPYLKKVPTNIKPLEL